MNQRGFWEDVRLSQKVREKVKKPAKKVLTFPRKFDNLYKLTRAGTRGTALNLENDTEQE